MYFFVSEFGNKNKNKQTGCHNIFFLIWQDKIVQKKEKRKNICMSRPYCTEEGKNKIKKVV